MSINACNPLHPPNRDPLLYAILSVLYQDTRTTQEIVDVISAQPPFYTDENIRRAIIQGTRQGLFRRVCTNDIPPFGTTFEPLYEFNPNAPSINTRNWPYMCPGAQVLTSGSICRSHPCRSKKGSYQTDLCCPPVPGPLAEFETITIPGVPGSFVRSTSLRSCAIPI